MRTSALATALLLALAAAHPARADTCALIEGGSPALAARTTDERIAAIQRGLREGARRARIWAWSWAGIYSALTVGQLASLPLRHGDDRLDVTIGAPGAFLGVLVLIISPLKVMGDQRRLDALLRSPAGDRCALLAEAERLLVRDAASEELSHSPVVHAGNFLFNLGLGLALGLAFGHWVQGVITTAVGFTVGEIQVATQPMDLPALLSRYRSGDLTIPPPPPPHITIAPSVSRDSATLTVAFPF